MYMYSKVYKYIIPKLFRGVYFITHSISIPEKTLNKMNYYNGLPTCRQIIHSNNYCLDKIWLSLQNILLSTRFCYDSIFTKKKIGTYI